MDSINLDMWKIFAKVIGIINVCGYFMDNELLMNGLNIQDNNSKNWMCNFAKIEHLQIMRLVLKINMFFVDTHRICDYL